MSYFLVYVILTQLTDISHEHLLLPPSSHPLRPRLPDIMEQTRLDVIRRNNVSMGSNDVVCYPVSSLVVEG